MPAISQAWGFITRSFVRLARSGSRRVFFIIVSLGAAALLILVIGDWFPRYVRIAFAGAVFGAGLIASIYFGLPAAFLTTIANTGGAVVSLHLHLIVGEWYYLAITVFQITTAVASIVIAIVADLEKDKKEQHLAASLTDPLTNLNNARYFRKRLAEEVERSQRRGTETSILFIDLDAFKLINDNFGHSVGDRVLIYTAQYLAESVRLSDVVCRQGGDEFVVVLPETPLEVAQNIGARMQARYPDYMKEVKTIPDGVDCGLSCGAASYPETGDLETLVEHADKELYRDKRERGTGRSI